MSRLSIKDYKFEARLFRARSFQAALLVLLLLLIVLARMAWLQIEMHSHYQTRSKENRVKLIPQGPTRGLIYDTNGAILAENQTTYTLQIIPERIKNIEGTIERLKQLLEISDEDIERFNKIRNQRRRFEGIPIRLRLTDEEVALFSVRGHEFPGVRIEATLMRIYPMNEVTAHVLGYVGRINAEELEQIDNSNYAGTSHIGKNGVEKSYEDVLHGQVGLQHIEVNAAGRNLQVLEQQPPVPGADLTLHLDIDVQQAAYEALGDYNGSVVAINPVNGGVLALVSKPGMNPNWFVEGIDHKTYRELQRSSDKPLFNRAVRGSYPPGSTIKPFFGLAGLETATIGATDKIFCPGFYQLPNHTHKYRDWKRTGHGSTDLEVAIEQSCDVYYYELAHRLGIDRMHSYMTQFGFGEKTGIDVPGESAALMPSRDWKKQRLNTAWYPGETLIAGIGQGYFLSTPLQLASATATLAMRGQKFAPRVVEYIETAEGKRYAPSTPAPEQVPIQLDLNWDIVEASMLKVTEGARGTARRIRNDRYRIAGKTGTAQVFTVKQDERYIEEEVAPELKDHALFMAYAPVDNPRIAVAVIVENGGHGGSVAAPIARKVMDAYLLKYLPETAVNNVGEQLRSAPEGNSP